METEVDWAEEIAEEIVEYTTEGIWYTKEGEIATVGDGEVDGVTEVVADVMEDGVV